MTGITCSSDAKFQSPHRSLGRARAATEGRYTVDPALSQVSRGDVLKGYYFKLSYRERTIAVQIRPGHVRDDFIALSRKMDRTSAEDVQLTFLKREMTERLFALSASEIYEVVE